MHAFRYSAHGGGRFGCSSFRTLFGLANSEMFISRHADKSAISIHRKSNDNLCVCLWHIYCLYEAKNNLLPIGRGDQ